MAQAHKLVDSEAGLAVLPEVLQELHEVVGIMFPGQAAQIKVSVAIGVEPVNLTVTIQPAQGIISLTPDGITTVYTAQHSLDKQQWLFQKEARAVCACGQFVAQTGNLALLKDMAVAHLQQAAAMPANLLSDAMDVGSLGVPPPACLACCEAWRACSLDMVPEDKLKALAGMIGASMAGYSDRGVYDLGLDDEVALAFEEVGKAVLEDESLFSLTTLVRPVRPAPDAEAAAKLAPWARNASCMPLTPWVLAQPWYLQYTASKDHQGVTGAETCLPARRAASRVRAEFSEMDAYDALPYDEQMDTVPPQVSKEAVEAKLTLVLQRSGDWRTPEQFVRRLGITLHEFAALVNLKEIGSLAIDMCCRCGIFVLDAQPAVACEHCVDVYHLQCQGLKSVPEGEWVCPGCTLASGATGKAAAAAAALGRSKGVAGRTPREGGRARGSRMPLPSPRGGPPQGRNGRESPTPRSSTAGSGRSGRGAHQRSTSAVPPPLAGAAGLPPAVMALPGVTSFKQESTSSDEPEDDGAMSDGGAGGGSAGGGPPSKRQRTSGNVQRRPSQRSRYGIFRVDPADAALYQTNCPGMPNPNADGRSLVLRIATVLLARQVAPISRRWRPQVMLSCNMVAGIHCEYHHNVVVDAPRVTLSEATLVHGGIRCNRCRRAVASGGPEQAPVPPPPPPAAAAAEGAMETAAPDAAAVLDALDGSAVDAPPADLTGQPGDMQVDPVLTGEGMPAPPPKPPVPPPPQPPPPAERVVGQLTECGQVFRRFIDFEKHLRANTDCPPCHIWLPKHRLYLQGVSGVFKGLTELAREETARNPNLVQPLAAATEAAEYARRRRIEEGRDGNASSDNDSAGAMPPPPPRSGMSQRQRSAQQAAVDRKSRASDKDAIAGAQAAGAAVAAAAPRQQLPRPIKRDIVPALPGFDPESVAKHQARVRMLMAVRLSEARVLAALPRAPLAAPAGAGVGGGAAGVAVKREAGEAAVHGGLASGGSADMAHASHSGLVQLVQVAGTEQFTLVPKDALDAALAAMDGAGKGSALDEDGLGDGSSSGIPCIPASLLPQLLAAGGSVVAPAADGLAWPAANAASASKVHSLRLFRRLSALAGACEGEAESAVLGALRGCRDAANAIPDAQIQLESMASIGELVTRLEGAVGPENRATGAGKLMSLLSDVRDLKGQLEEWTGSQTGKME